MRKSIFIGVLLIFIISVLVTVFVVYKYGFGSLRSIFGIERMVGVILPDCYMNEECIPETPLMGVQYLCENGECIEKIFGNPASTNCQERGGRVEMREDTISDGTYGVCVFSDGSECEEWKFFKETCFVGDFNPNDEIWEGSVIDLQRAKYDYYFSMLNGDKLGIDSKDTDIKEILSALQYKENKIIVKGKIVEGVADISGRQLDVVEILDLGDVQFKKVTKEESGYIAKKAVEESDEYIYNKGRNIKLIKIVKINCPYCWEFRFSYIVKRAGEKLVDVLVQEGEVKDISEFKEEKIFYDCSEFSIVQVCTQQYDPVCARVEKQEIGIVDGSGSVDLTNDNIQWKTFSNPCVACTYSMRGEKTTSYKMGKCKLSN